MATLTPEAHPGGQLTLMTADATATVNPLSIEVDNLDLVWRRAQEVGADVIHERSVEPWGVERFFGRDPSGNVINSLAHADAASTGTCLGGSGAKTRRGQRVTDVLHRSKESSGTTIRASWVSARPYL